MILPSLVCISSSFNVCVLEFIRAPNFFFELFGNYCCFISYNLQDMKIDDPEIVELVNQIEELERKLHDHPLHKVCICLTLNPLLVVTKDSLNPRRS